MVDKMSGDISAIFSRHVKEALRSIDNPTAISGNEEQKSFEKGNAYADAHESEDVRKKKIQNDANQQDNEERKKYAGKLYNMIIFWLIIDFIVILLYGFGDSGVIPKFSLSDSIVLALIGGTTANVLGLFTIVALYLFHRKSNT